MNLDDYNLTDEEMRYLNAISWDVLNHEERSSRSTYQFRVVSYRLKPNGPGGPAKSLLDKGIFVVYQELPGKAHWLGKSGPPEDLTVLKPTNIGWEFIDMLISFEKL